MGWAIVEQDEGYIVEVTSGNTLVFMVDYSECKENPRYVTEKLEELEDWSDLPKDHVARIRAILMNYPHDRLFQE